MNTGKNAKTENSFLKIYGILCIILWLKSPFSNEAKAGSEVFENCKELTQEEFLKKCDDKTIQICGISGIPESGIFQVEWARRQYSEKQFNEAETYLRDKSQISPFDINLGLALAEILAKNNKPQEAESELSRLASIYPKSAKVKSLRGRLFIEQGKIKEANADFRIVITSAEGQKSFLDSIRFIDTSLSLKNIKEAQDALIKTKSYGSQDAYLLDYEWGRFYHVTGESVLAKRYYEAALQSRPNSEASASAYVDLLIETKKEQEAIKIIERYSYAGGSNPLIFIKLGMIHFRNREYSSAKKIFQNIIDQSQDDKVLQRANVSMVRVEVAEGNVDSAVRRLEKINTKFKWAWVPRSLSRLYFLANQKNKAAELARETVGASGSDLDKKWLAALENNGADKEVGVQISGQENLVKAEFISSETAKLVQYLSGNDEGELSKGKLVKKDTPNKLEMPPIPQEHTVVRRNETLAGVSNRVFGTHKKWKYLLKLNKDKISHADQITPGLVLRTGSISERAPATDVNSKNSNEIDPKDNNDSPKKRRKNKIDEFTKVKRNESLAEVSYRVFGTHTKWKFLQKINHDLISDPNRIPTGLKIRIKNPSQEIAEMPKELIEEDFP